MCIRDRSASFHCVLERLGCAVPTLEEETAEQEAIAATAHTDKAKFLISDFFIF